MPEAEPSAITAAVIECLVDVVRSISAFDCEFAASTWFGEEILGLAPRPDEPFRSLTHAVSAAFRDTCLIAGSLATSFLTSPSVTDLPEA